MKKTKGQNDYAGLLRDPRWQRKRLEVLNAHGFKCDECGDDKSELQVHHCYYEKGNKPWEYEDDCFKVLCNVHHKEWHENKTGLDQAIAKLSVDSLGDIWNIASALNKDDLTNISTIINGREFPFDLFKMGAWMAWEPIAEWQKGHRDGMAAAAKGTKK